MNTKFLIVSNKEFSQLTAGEWENDTYNREWIMWRTVDLVTEFTTQTTLESVVETIWAIDLEPLGASQDGQLIIPQAIYDFAVDFYENFHSYDMFEGGLKANI